MSLFGTYVHAHGCRGAQLIAQVRTVFGYSRSGSTQVDTWNHTSIAENASAFGSNNVGVAQCAYSANFIYDFEIII